MVQPQVRRLQQKDLVDQQRKAHQFDLKYVGTFTLMFISIKKKNFQLYIFKQFLNNLIYFSLSRSIRVEWFSFWNIIAKGGLLITRRIIGPSK